MTLSNQTNTDQIRQGETRLMAQKISIGSLILSGLFVVIVGSIAVAAF